MVSLVSPNSTETFINFEFIFISPRDSGNLSDKRNREYFKNLIFNLNVGSECIRYCTHM